MGKDQHEASSPSSDLITEARLEAKRQLSEWIRCTLRQSFLEGLPHKWKIETGNRIAFSAEALQECIQFVHKISQKWQESLKGASHNTTALWVEEVYQNGLSTFWSESIQISKDDEKGGTDNDNRRGGNNILAERTQKETESADDDRSDNVKVVTTDNSSNNNNDDYEEQHDEDAMLSSCKVPYISLRNLGKKGSDTMSSPKEALPLLNQMGESGESYWPLDWKLIDGVCSEIPNRFKSETSTTNLAYQVIPKSLASSSSVAISKTNQYSDDDADDDNNSGVVSLFAVPPASTTPVLTTTETTSTGPAPTFNPAVATILSDILERKRKNPPGKSGPKRLRLSNDDVMEESRPPSDNLDILLIELSKKEKEQLERRYINDDNDDENKVGDVSEKKEPPMSILFGPLDNVGNIHNFLQHNDWKGEGLQNTTLTDKEKRRKFRDGIKERIHPRIMIKNKDIQRFQSRILRTEDRDDDTKKYFELDLGWSLLEATTKSSSDDDGGKTPEKGYFAFSSLEIELDDNELNEALTGDKQKGKKG